MLIRVASFLGVAHAHPTLRFAAGHTQTHFSFCLQPSCLLGLEELGQRALQRP